MLSKFMKSNAKSNVASNPRAHEGLVFGRAPTKRENKRLASTEGASEENFIIFWTIANQKTS